MTGASETIAVGDVGGTHARFARATLSPDAPPAGGAIHKYRTAEHDGLASAWSAFAADSGMERPDAASIAVAAPIESDVLRFTNSHWAIDRRTIGDRGALPRYTGLLDTGHGGAYRRPVRHDPQPG